MDNNTVFKIPQPKISDDIPKLCWKNKHSISEIPYYPAQLRETYGQEQNGWINKIFWGDNLQVMSHMLKDYRGKIDLIYIDPPFCSQVNYKKKIKIPGIDKTESGSILFEEKQYGDIWTNDEYLQFMYERLLLMRELLSDRGVIVLHCDYHKSHYLRIVMDEVFGPDRFVNEIIWYYETYQGAVKKYFPRKHDNLFVYSKTGTYFYEMQYDNDYKNSINYKRWENYVVDGNKIKGANYPANDSRFTARLNKWIRENGRQPNPDDVIFEIQSVSINSVWKDIKPVDPKDLNEKLNYPTQKPAALLDRIIRSFSQPGDIVFDCFMGSGTTQAVAMKLGRRFIGADINLGAIQTTTKRLIRICNSRTTKSLLDKTTSKYKNFAVFTIGNQTSKNLATTVNVYRDNNLLIIDSPDINQINSVMIDWNYDNKVLKPTLFDIPNKQSLVRTKYEIPNNTTNIGIKITDIFDRFIILKL